MPMFKKGKPEAGKAAVEAHTPTVAAMSQPAAVERAVAREVPVAAAPAPAGPPAQEAAAPAGTGAGAGAALMGGETATPAAAPTPAIDDATTSQLMHIFTEDQEGLNANATIYESFLEQLTMEQVAANARALLDELRSIG